MQGPSARPGNRGARSRCAHLGARIFKPDLYWPEYRMAVEYSNRAWPSAQERLNYDKLVRNAYRMLGITAISLGKDDLSDDARLRKRFELVNRKCKRRLPDAKRSAFGSSARIARVDEQLAFRSTDHTAFALSSLPS